MKNLALTTTLVLSLCTIASAGVTTLTGGIDLPGDARPLSSHYDAQRALLLIGTHSTATRDELYAIGFDIDGKTPHIAWSIDISGSVDSIASDGAYAYVASTVNNAELIVIDLTTGTAVGAFDADGNADGLHVTSLSPGVVQLDRRLSAHPERYVLDVSSPLNVSALSSTQCASEVSWPPAEASSSVYAYPGRLVSEVNVSTTRGTVYYGVSLGAALDLYVIERLRPVRFADANGDGVFRLGCVGDSNTAHSNISWCHTLRSVVGDPKQFNTANVAVPGATAVAPNLRFDSDSGMQMIQALGLQVDAVVLAFGTNDYFQLRTPMQVVAAYVAQAEAAAEAGVAFYVATTPPIMGCATMGCPGIQAINDAVRAAFDNDQVIDFWDGFGPSEFGDDGYHVNAAGHSLRAARVYNTIKNPALP